MPCSALKIAENLPPFGGLRPLPALRAAPGDRTPAKALVSGHVAAAGAGGADSESWRPDDRGHAVGAAGCLVASQDAEVAFVLLRVSNHEREPFAVRPVSNAVRAPDDQLDYGSSLGHHEVATGTGDDPMRGRTPEPGAGAR